MKVTSVRMAAVVAGVAIEKNVNCVRSERLRRLLRKGSSRGYHHDHDEQERRQFRGVRWQRGVGYSSVRGRGHQ